MTLRFEKTSAKRAQRERGEMCFVVAGLSQQQQQQQQQCVFATASEEEEEEEEEEETWAIFI